MDLYGFMPSYYWYAGMGLFVMAMYFLIILYGIPFLQAVVEYQNQKWLRSTLGRMKDLDESTRNRILDEAKPETTFPLYKFTKFSYLTYGIIAFVAGFLVIILQDADPDSLKNLVYVPIFLGAAVMAIYKLKFPNSHLWKEAAGFLGVLGICISIPGIFGVNDWDWMRSDILAYIVLAASLAVVHYLDSTVASLVYIVAVSAASSMLRINVDAGWMDFFKSFIWFFALAPLVFWMPKLKTSKAVGVKEVAFGVLFFIMMISVTFSNLGRLGVLGCAIMIPIMYMFSKVHFKQDGWFLTKPIQSLIILGTYIGILVLCYHENFEFYPSFKSQFAHFSFATIIDYLVIAAMIFGAVMMFRDNFENDLSKINLAVLGFPILVYLLGFLSDYSFVEYIFIALLVYFGWTYLDGGLKGKESLAIILGASGVLSIIPVLYSKLPAESLDEPTVIGLLIMIYGGAMVGLTFYMRSQWKVTEVVENDVLGSMVHQENKANNGENEDLV